MPTVDDSSIPVGGSGGMPGIPWYLDLFLIVLVAVLVTAPVMAVISAVRGRRRGGGTPAATFALWLTRLAMLGLVGLLFAWAGQGTVWEVTGGARLEGDRVTVPAYVQEASFFCPLAQYDDVGGPSYGPGDCVAARAIQKSTSPNGKVTGYVTDVDVPASSSTRRKIQVIGIAGDLFLLLGLLALERILAQSSGRREPFSRSSVWWLRVLAVVVFVDGFLLPVLGQSVSTFAVQDAPMHHYFGLQPLHNDYGGFTGIAVAILILVVAEVWNQGIHLREDVEATV